MNATELFAPTKTTSSQSTQIGAAKPEMIETRDLKASELLFVGGGDLFAGIL